MSTLNKNASLPGPASAKCNDQNIDNAASEQHPQIDLLETSGKNMERTALTRTKGAAIDFCARRAASVKLKTRTPRYVIGSVQREICCIAASWRDLLGAPLCICRPEYFKLLGLF